MTPAELLKTREGLELTQEEFAEVLGISRVHYNRIENGEAPITKTIAILAAIVAKPVIQISHETQSPGETPPSR